jgi:hypothetical protein
MNEWLSGHGIGKRVPVVNGGTILLDSCREGENKYKKICERRVYEERGGKEEGKSGNFREIVKRKASICLEIYRKDQVL